VVVYSLIHLLPSSRVINLLLENEISCNDESRVLASLDSKSIVLANHLTNSIARALNGLSSSLISSGVFLV